MTTIFEQSRDLSGVVYRRLVRVFSPILLVYGGILSAVLVFGLWRRLAAGEQVPAWNWIAAAGAGIFVVALGRLGLLRVRTRRRYIKFQGERLFLSDRGAFPIRRFIKWSLSPDAIEPRYVRLQLVYRFGLGRKRWGMLLDDDKEISELRHALTSQIPQKEAT